ncbi:unnamed protein product [Trichogramma brassicae]|uniref:Uncharacterized protein n=1 Tax=Trichogramma brassicae TaxID=86971 RepID=A0A6H5HU58_9HYME|nr:unnamed protein product [Trichogramma brassicae]
MAQSCKYSMTWIKRRFILQRNIKIGQLWANSSFNIMTDVTCFSRVTINVVPRHSIIDQAASETGDLLSSKLCEPKLDYENCTSKLFEENVEFMEKSTTPSKNVPFIRTTKRRPIQHGKVVKRTTVRSSDKASEANSNKTLACQINSTQKKNKKDNKLQKQLSDFFPVRKSTRKPQTVLLEEKQKELVDKILNHCHDGLEHRFNPRDWKDVFPIQQIQSFLVAYVVPLDPVEYLQQEIEHFWIWFDVHRSQCPIELHRVDDLTFVLTIIEFMSDVKENRKHITQGSCTYQCSSLSVQLQSVQRARDSWLRNYKLERLVVHMHARMCALTYTIGRDRSLYIKSTYTAVSMYKESLIHAASGTHVLRKLATIHLNV